MTDFDQVSKIIDRYAIGPDFVGPVHPDRIREAEEQLTVRFPKSYRQFLERYGCGIFGCEIYGVTMSNTGIPSTVWYTLKLREEGFLPAWMVIVCNEGEYTLCLDTSTFDDLEECKVLSWILGLPFVEQPFELTFDSFADFLYEECVQPAIEEGWWE